MRGVTRDKATNKWRARIQTAKGTVYVGYYELVPQAIEARDIGEQARDDNPRSMNVVHIVKQAVDDWRIENGLKPVVRNK